MKLFRKATRPSRTHTTEVMPRRYRGCIPMMQNSSSRKHRLLEVDGRSPRPGGRYLDRGETMSVWTLARCRSAETGHTKSADLPRVRPTVASWGLANTSLSGSDNPPENGRF